MGYLIKTKVYHGRDGESSQVSADRGHAFCEGRFFEAIVGSHPLCVQVRLTVRLLIADEKMFQSAVRNRPILCPAGTFRTAGDMVSVQFKTGSPDLTWN